MQCPGLINFKILNSPSPVFLELHSNVFFCFSNICGLIGYKPSLTVPNMHSFAFSHPTQP